MILDDNMGIKRIKIFYNELREELAGVDEITIDFSNLRRADLSLIQLIVAAGREARKKGKTIKLKYVSDIIKTQMSVCGLKTDVHVKKK